MDQFVVANAKHVNACSQILLLIGSDHLRRHPQTGGEIRPVKGRTLDTRQLGSVLQGRLQILGVIASTQTNITPLLPLKRTKDGCIRLDEGVPFRLDGAQTLEHVGLGFLCIIL